MHTRSSIVFNAVTIECDRLTLAPISEQYAQIIFNEFTDEITRLMMPATPTHIDQVKQFIGHSNSNMDQNTELTLAILEKDSKEFLGVCALHGRPSPDEPILGIWLKKGAHGKRYGREAISFLVDWARRNLIFNYLVYPCDKDNIPSRRIAESLNGKIFRTAEVKSMSGRLLNEVAYRIV